jgi:hypothetical protein
MPWSSVAALCSAALPAADPRPVSPDPGMPSTWWPRPEPALVAAAPEHLPEPAGRPTPAPVVPAAPPGEPDWGAPQVCEPAAFGEPGRKLFQSDHAFDGFVGPITNPILSKDPRSNTYLRFLYVENDIPDNHPLGGGDIQVFGMQANLALTERLSIIADKDGFANVQPGAAPGTTGLVNIAAGLKYAFIRDVENQFLLSGVLMFEPPTGEEEVFSGIGAGVFSTSVTAGKEVACDWHVLNTFGYQFPANARDNSSFLYNSFHIDRRLWGCVYPLAELNWFHYTAGGKLLPAAIGEGDGLLNLGTMGAAGNDLVTGALGVKAVVTQNLILGAAYEVPLTSRNDLLQNRLTVEAIVRY